MKSEIDYNNGSRRTIRFGIICRGMIFESWQADCLRKLMSLANVKIVLVIKDDNTLTFRNVMGKSMNLWSLYCYLFVRNRCSALNAVDMASALSNIPSIQCITKTQEARSYFGETDIAEIQKYDLDFLLHFGLNFICGDVLRIASFGVWAFHHGDIDKYRGLPPAFREIYLNDLVTGSVLYRCADDLDNYLPLRRGFFKTVNFSYGKNLEETLFQSSEWPAQVCKDIINGNTDYMHGSLHRSMSPVFGPPDSVQTIFFMIKVLYNLIYKVYRYLFFYEIWNIGIANAPIHEFLNSDDLPPVKWLPEGSLSRFVADPFAICKDKIIHILFEEYDYRSIRGFISAISVNDNTVSPARVVFKNHFHMSYPYLFEHGEQLYCIPETGEANEVSMYRAEEFPDRWTKVATLISNFSGIDSTVFQYEDRWWLFATELNDGFNLKLKVWYAPDLMGPWTPHAGNPVKTDIRSSRPAGTPFFHDGCLYRPSQDCSRSYGGRIIINRVVRLTPTEFEEEQAAVVGPYRNSPYPDGFHTISAVGGMTVVDGKKFIFIGKRPFMIYHNIKRIFKTVDKYIP